MTTTATQDSGARSVASSLVFGRCRKKKSSRLTIVRYSAAISGESGNTTGCRRGEIAGRWTKPVAATQLAASHGKPSRCRGPDLGKGSAGLGVSALAHRDAHATLARPASDIGDGPFVPGPVQVVPGGVG